MHRHRALKSSGGLDSRSRMATSGQDNVKESARGVAFMLRALSHRNYKLFFSGQSISLIGTWMTRIATSWLVYRLTGSALLLGVVGFAGQIPSFLLAPFAGVLVDRWNRHHLLVATLAGAMFLAARKSVLGLGAYIPLTAAAFGAGL